MMEYFPATTSISIDATAGYMIEYFPVEFTESQYNLQTNGTKYKIAWYTKDSIIHHRRVLISYAHRPDKPLREIFNDEGVKILGDSGGFQAVQLKMDINANDVIKWQNENCDIGITLDRPPLSDLVNISKEAWHKGNEFDKYMRISNDNANLMMNKRRQDLKLYLALHGYDEATRTRWLEDGLKEYQDWDGYAIACKPNSDIELLADWLLFAKRHRLRNLHFLAISGANTLPIMVYMSKYFDNIYFDSSSYSMGSRQRQYFLPFSVKGKLTFSTQKDNKGIPETLPCDCGVCSKIRDTSIFSNPDTGTGLAGWLCNMHNIIQTQRYISLLSGIVHDREIFAKIVGKNVMEIISYLDDRLAGKGQTYF